MFITTHASAALAVGSLAHSPVIGFFAALISHFILDIIPHGDTEMTKSQVNPKTGIEEFIDKKERNLFIKIALVDNFLAISLLFILHFLSFINIFEPTLFFSLVGAVIPDIIRGIAIFFQPQWLILYTKFHDGLHSVISWTISLKSGIFLQIILISLFLYLLL